MVKCGPYISALEISNRVREISQVIRRGLRLLCCQSDQSASKRFLCGLKKSRNRSPLRSCTACLRLSYVRYRTRHRMGFKSNMRMRSFRVAIFGSLHGWQTIWKIQQYTARIPPNVPYVNVLFTCLVNQHHTHCAITTSMLGGCRNRTRRVSISMRYSSLTMLFGLSERLLQLNSFHQIFFTQSS